MKTYTVCSNLPGRPDFKIIAAKSATAAKQEYKRLYPSIPYKNIRATIGGE